ncbi:hypothetical protein SPURM210S_02693 [Streptomyces purpurascens]
MVLLVYGFIRAAQDGWRDPLTVASFVGAVVVLAAFILIERRSRQPITPLHMFADRNRAGTYGIMLCLAAAIFGMFFFLTLFVQNVLGFSPLAAGLAFLPVSAVIAVGAGLASRFLPVYGPKPFMVVGAILAAAGLAWLTLTDVHSTYAGSVLGPMLVFSLGMGMEFVSLTLMALSNVATPETGAASGLLNATQQVGGSLGLSILVTMYGTASTNEADKQIPDFLRQATPSERLRFEQTGQVPKPCVRRDPHRRRLGRLHHGGDLHRRRRADRPRRHPGPPLRPGTSQGRDGPRPDVRPAPGVSTPRSSTR